MSHATADDLYTVIRCIRPLFKHLYAGVEAEVTALGFTIPMRGVLECLHDDGPSTVPQIARRLGVKRQFVQRTVDEMLARHLVERRPNPASRRSPLIDTTAEGAAAFGAIRSREAAASAEIAAHLSQADVETCRRVLEYLVDAFGRRAVAQEEGDDAS